LNKSNTSIAGVSVSISLLSVAIIAFQLSLIQILSIVQWYHFAYMVISVALLGFGAAGTTLSFAKKFLIEKSELFLPRLMILSGLAMTISVSLAQAEAIRFDSYLLFADYTHIWKLLATYLLFFIPFFLGALAIGIVFIKYIDKIGTLYFANMLGSGLGGVVAVFLMWIFLPEKLPAVIVGIAFLAGLIVISKEQRTSFTIIVTITVAVLSFMYISPARLEVSEYKSLSRTLNPPESKIIFKESSPYGLIDIVSTPYLRYAPGLSIKYHGIVTVENAAFNNGEWIGPLISTKTDSLSYLLFTTENLAFITSERKNVLVLGAGTGRQVKTALLNDAETVTSVEPNKALINLLEEKLASKVDSLYQNKSVRLQNISPRTFLLSTHQKFDLISLPVIDTYGGSSGMYALQEQYLLTIEAFNEMLNALNRNGAICISTYIDYPYRNPLKILATFAEVLGKKKIDNPEKYIAAIKNWNTITFLIKRDQVSSSEIDSIRNFCGRMNFDPVLLPVITEAEREKFNKLQDTTIYSMLDRILQSKEERENLYSEYPFNIKPATDNQPYFSQFLQWKTIPLLAELLGNQSVPFFEVGYLLLYLTFIQILVLAFLFILLPLFKIGFKGGNKIRTLAYFSGLGLGYMFIEIILIQRFTLYFGNVIYAAALVVCLMLVSSGFGSLVSQKITPKPYRIILIIFIIIVSLLIYTLFLSGWLKATIGFSLTAKIILSFLLIAPPAFFMGMPFPLGLKLLSSRNESAAGQVPWAWGINGVFSVVSAVLATIIAVELGFVWVMIFAIGAYCLVLASNIRRV
jgi:spermidine synthase